MNYAVIFTYSFDGQVSVYLFPDEASAKVFLKDSFEQEARIDEEENGWDTSAEIDEDGWNAKITNHFDDRDEVTEFRIGQIYL